jgi:CheY-like chemotaxis protein
MWAESPGPGHGATLHLTLALDAQASPRNPDSRPILVVDDDESLRELIVDTLRDEGYHLSVARDGLEALDQVAADPPALILLDWMMPRLGGEGFATELRERHPTLDVPIVVMTAGGVAHERAASIGANGFISKPFELAVLLDQVARHFAPRATDAAPPA